MVESSLRGLIKSFGAISDSILINDGKGEVDIVEERVDMIGGWINVGLLMGVELWDSVELNELQTKGLGSKLLGDWVAAVAAATEEIVTTD